MRCLRVVFLPVIGLNVSAMGSVRWRWRLSRAFALLLSLIGMRTGPAFLALIATVLKGGFFLAAATARPAGPRGPTVSVPAEGTVAPTVVPSTPALRAGVGRIVRVDVQVTRRLLSGPGSSSPNRRVREPAAPHLISTSGS